MKKKCKDCKKLKDKLMFYGVQGECKECSKKRIKANYYNNREHYIKYEQERFKNPKRKAKLIIYQRKRRLKNKGKNKARQAINYAVKNGKVIKLNCKVCNSVYSQAHHTDYRKKLDVLWLCRKHHLELEGKQAF